jgi:hypothetical protein
MNGGNSYFCEDISFGFLQWYASKQLFHICVCFSFYTLSLFSADLASAHMRVIRSRSQKARSGNESHHSQLASHVGISASSLCTSSHFSRELLKTPYKLCFRHGIPATKKDSYISEPRIYTLIISSGPLTRAWVQIPLLTLFFVMPFSC